MRKFSFNTNRFMAALLTVILMLALLPPFAIPVQAAGTPVLDQVNTTVSTYENIYANYLAQTFTAGRSGVLSQVDLYMYTTNTLDAGFRVWIEEVRDDPQDLYYGAPNGIASGYSGNDNTRWIKGSANSWQWCSIDFDQRVRVQAGKKYAICVKGLTSNAFIGGYEPSADPYAGGEVYEKSRIEYPWMKYYPIIKDLAFRTYVSSPSNDASLNAGLTVENGQLNDNFFYKTTDYTVLMDMNQTSLKITPSLYLPTAATITVDGIACKNGSTQTVSVPVDRDIPIVVTAEDGTTTKTYTLKAAHSYTVGFAPLSGGSIQAGPLVKKQGTTINLTITPDLFKRLKPGSLKYNDGTGDVPVSGTSFSMPASNVTVSAIFLDATQTATRKVHSINPGGISCLYVNSEGNYILARDGNNQKLYSVNSDTCEVGAAFTVDSTSARDSIGIVDSPGTNKMYILNNGSKNISVYDYTNFNRVDHFIAVGANPCDLTWNSSLNRLYTVNRDVDSVSMINGATDTVFHVGVGSQPCDMALDTTTNKIYVANSGSNNVTVLDGAADSTSGAVLATVPAGSAPCAVAVDPVAQRAYVTNSGSNNVTVINTADNSVAATVSVGAAPSAIEINPNTHKIYVANSTGNTLTIIDGSTFDTATVPVGNHPMAIAVNPNNNVVYVLNSGSQSVTAVDENDRTINYALGIAPVGIAVNTKTNRVYVAHSHSDSWDIITEIPALIPVALTVSNPTAAGITVSLNPTVETLVAGDFVIHNSSGAAVSVSGAVTEDVGSTYQINAALEEGQTYSVTALSPGYSFGVAKSFTVPGTPVKTYQIGIGTLAGGSITATPSTTTAGATVQLTIKPDAGKQLKAGTLKYSNGMTDSAISGTSFTMPAANVTVTAEFENVPASTYTVSIGTLTGGSITATPSTTTAGATVQLTITPDPSKQLKACTLKYNDGMTDSAISGTSFTMPAANVTVSAEFENVPASVSNADKVAVDKAALSIGYAAGDNDTSVTRNLNLTVTGAVYGSSITWSSSNSAVISNSGKVTRPAYTSGDAAVTVTATVYNAGASDTKAFNLVVLKLPQTTCTITFNKNGGDTEASPATKTAVSGGNSGTLPIAPTKSGYTFSGWNTMADGTGTAFTAATTVNADLTVYAQWTVISSVGGGGGSSTPNTTLTTPTPTPTPTPTTTTTTKNTGTASSSVTSTTSTEAKSDSNGKATATVSENQVKEAVNKAVEEAAKQGEGTAAKVEIKVTAPAEAKTVEASLPKAAVTAVADSKTDALTTATPVATITFDKAAITTISKEAAADVKITASKVNASDLSEAAKAAVGDRPVFNFRVTSGDKTISQFGGTVTVSVPYTPKAGEDTKAIVIYYINAEGKAEIVKDCVCDKETGMITFKTNHFSKYAVGYNKVSFKDVDSAAWYSDAISFVAARGITTGTGNGKFNPEENLTRGQFLVMVMRAYGIESDSALNDNFTDAGNTYYTGYLAAAKKLGITVGIGNNMFAPDKEITRQEMFSLLYNTLKQIGELPVGTSGKTLSSYTDASEIASWAKEAMTLFVKTGTVSGSGGNLNPADTTNRAQLAQVLYSIMSK
ncbi:MAG: S-layer homology domain-containing protein [Clostridiaceae bacterium]